MKILVINPGSTSTKFAIFEGDNLELTHSGQFDCIHDHTTGEIRYTRKIDEEKAEISKDEFDNPVWKIKLTFPQIDFDKIGFRVVHGGEYFTNPAILNNESIQKIETLCELAPLHNPHSVAKIKEALEAYPDVVKYAVFDTQFHATIPEKAYLYALPYEFYRNFKIRKYGFHGISHEYLYSQLKNTPTISPLIKWSERGLKVITCHLGGGASICAIKDGKSIDTSMGFTPSEGLVMATRTGDIDSGIRDYLQNKLEMDDEDMRNIYNYKSGLLGLSEETSNMLELIELYQKGNEGAVRALNVYIYKIQKYIGSYVATLGGLDVLIFSGGVGSGSDFIREKVCTGLEIFGIEIDKNKNNGQIDVPDYLEIGKGQVKILAIKTNEELAIAQKIIL
jgi:acetate kinase